jgi:cGMP-dependent protein kinase 1
VWAPAMHVTGMSDPVSIPALRADQDAAISVGAKEFAIGVLQQSHILSKLPAEQLQALVQRMTKQQCSAGQIIVRMGTRAKHVVVLQHGECIAAKAQVDDKTTVQTLRSVGHTFMVRGDFYGEIMLIKRQRNPASIVAMCNNTVVLVLTMADLMEVTGASTDVECSEMLLKLLSRGTEETDAGLAKVPFRELAFHRVVGRGQFGSVRMATHAATGQTFALKTIYKQPISDAKQVEHLINELTVMQACRSPFCVQVRH